MNIIREKLRKKKNWRGDWTKIMFATPPLDSSPTEKGPKIQYIKIVVSVKCQTTFNIVDE